MVLLREGEGANTVELDLRLGMGWKFLWFGFSLWIYPTDFYTSVV
jgi:hypothetical protein